ncbi:hypothetical protein CJP74_06950 [Psittacicella melopsittaci]|uniref:Restriction endonuclease type II NgoFVII C-terminal B3-like DNA-binding domain-containing protein n=1 Tax=Psittacicella melopsittaci TaxID=2028576 RepID=A0A3A1Y695_9GAMM|nr:NgoFVII family restriction endonuclease [Psittacicella melopsittaci]RIY31574.1 hypothetical protein CJP74_06950 [Psittacicella melopsittaci]
MADILWHKLDKAKQDKYIKRITILGILSGLFKEVEGKNGKKPYLHYRNHEISYIDSFEVQGITRKDSAFDAIVRINNKSIGVGLKTWIHNSDFSNQKIAEFNRKSSEIRKLFNVNTQNELVKRIAELRNSRIEDDKRLYETEEEIYHFITRDYNCFYIIETKYEKIDIDNISDIRMTDTSVSFNDGKNSYIFNMSKSTLFKKFNASKEERILHKEINIHNDPFSLLEEVFSNSSLNNYIFPESQPNVKEEENYIILPLYNDNSYEVNDRSAFNASLGSSKSKGSDIPRPAYEAYAPIPVYIHRLYPNFFGIDALDKEARKNSSFYLHLPNGEKIIAKITQDNGKSLQTNPQSILGKWLLFSIFGLNEYEKLTRKLIDEKEIDSIKITKIDNNNFKVDVSNYLEYEKWKLEHKNKILELKEAGIIKKEPIFRPDLFKEEL